MAFEFDLWGWYAGEVEEGAERATATAPPLLSTADTLGAPRANWSGAHWTVRPYEPPPAPPAQAPVPRSISRRQARQALLLAGLLAHVRPAIDAIPDETQRAFALIEWEDSQVFERDRPVLMQLAQALGLDSEQLDQLFITAAGL